MCAAPRVFFFTVSAPAFISFLPFRCPRSFCLGVRFFFFDCLGRVFVCLGVRVFFYCLGARKAKLRAPRQRCIRAPKLFFLQEKKLPCIIQCCCLFNAGGWVQRIGAHPIPRAHIQFRGFAVSFLCLFKFHVILTVLSYYSRVQIS